MTLAGFIVIGLGLTLQRMTATGGLPIAVMSAGKALVAFGLNVHRGRDDLSA